MTIELALLSRVSFRGQEITGGQPRALLALLAAEPKLGCGIARLVDGLWPDERPEHPTKALQLVVSRARARLGPGVILSSPNGYRLALPEDRIDAAAVPLHAAAAERSAAAGDPAAALERAEAGLALCDGAASWGAGPSDDPLSALRASRLPAYRSLTRTRALALARLGGPALEPLREAARRQPRDEEVLVELLRCEAAALGPAIALARYEDYRKTLRDELGSDPGPAVREAYQVLLRADAPVVRHGVLAEPNPLLGRDKDLAAVTDLLRAARVTSIVGPGGLGKTRLAHAVADAAEQRVVHLVGLAGVTADADVAGEVASALGVREAGLSRGARLPSRAATIGAVVDALGPGPALLVLDNCEHVVRGAAALVQDLVSASRGLRVLTTSRAPLRLSAESVYHLPALDLPTMVELFAQRARAVRPDAELPPGVVRELCGRLDGLPLAVELAAARVRVMSVTEIARRLDDRFTLLRGSHRDAPERHHTLHAVIDWSWHLLAPAGRAAMRALSVFPGGFTASAARHVLGADDVLEQLVDQSLLTVADSGAGTRFRMLETVREFSAARRADAGEHDEVVDRFLAWARDFGVRWQEDADLTDGLLAVDAVRADQENLLLALRYGLDRADGPAVAGAAAALGALWITESNIPRLAELARDTAWVLSHLRPDPALVEVTRTALVLVAVFGFLMPGPNPLRAVVALRRLPDPRPDTLIRAAQIALCAPDAAALDELAESPEPLLAGITDYLRSYLCEYANDLPGALRAARRMRASVGDDDRVVLLRALAHSRVGELSLHSDPGEEAYRNLHAALSITERLGWSTTRGQWALVLANLQRGAWDEAERGLAAAKLPAGADDPVDLERYETCVRAQLRLGRGDVEGGLRLWRQAADRSLADGREQPEIGLWPHEAVAVAVLRHARYGRLGLAADIVDALPGILSSAVPTLSIVEFPVGGSLLLALAVADIDRGRTASGARLVALAERFGVFRGWTPELTPARITEIGRDADGPAYADAVSAYAVLDHDGLRTAALAAVRDRGQAGSRRNNARAQR